MNPAEARLVLDKAVKSAEYLNQLKADAILNKRLAGGFSGVAPAVYGFYKGISGEPRTKTDDVTAGLGGAVSGVMLGSGLKNRLIFGSLGALGAPLAGRLGTLMGKSMGSVAPKEEQTISLDEYKTPAAIAAAAGMGMLAGHLVTTRREV